MKKLKNIPTEFLQPLIDYRFQSDDWSSNKFKTLIEDHKDKDNKSGYTCRYILRNEINSAMITKNEFEKMIKTGLISEDFYNNKTGYDHIEVNQHYIHSLDQFYAVCQKEWDKHLERTENILNTPAGRIYK
ncbi:MAG: hypothetical protein PHH73_06070 [Candidatus Rickettsiella isopodorum]|nr:hypothetical protein [Candidatus Rickettsiella isopodorum]